MIDYENIEAGERKELSALFSEWIDWFIKNQNIDTDAIVLTDADGKDFTVADYVRDVKQTFGFMSPCKEYLSGAYAKGGEEAALQVMRSTAPLVLFDCNVDNSMFSDELR